MGLRGQEGGSWDNGEGAQPLGSEAVGVWPGLGGRRPGSAETTAPLEQHCSTLPSEHCCALEMPASWRSEGRRATHAHRGAGAGSEWLELGRSGRRPAAPASAPACFQACPTFFLSQVPRFVSAKRGLVFPERVLLFLENKQTPARHHPNGRRNGGGKWPGAPACGGWGLWVGGTSTGPPQLGPPLWGSRRRPSEARSPHGEQQSWLGCCFDTVQEVVRENSDTFQLPNASLSSQDCRQGSRAPGFPPQLWHVLSVCCWEVTRTSLIPSAKSAQKEHVPHRVVARAT